MRNDCTCISLCAKSLCKTSRTTIQNCSVAPPTEKEKEILEQEASSRTSFIEVPLCRKLCLGVMTGPWERPSGLPHCTVWWMRQDRAEAAVAGRYLRGPIRKRNGSHGYCGIQKRHHPWQGDILHRVNRGWSRRRKLLEYMACLYTHMQTPEVFPNYAWERTLQEV